jgi:hypothetical protein
MIVSDQASSQPNESTRQPAQSSKKWWLIGLALLVIFVVAFVGLTGFFAVPPIGAVPEGVTIWYFRSGLNIPFTSSPDSLAMDESGRLSLMGRASGIAAFMDVAEDRIIARLPFSRAIYQRSTGGRSWDF